MKVDLNTAGTIVMSAKRVRRVRRVSRVSRVRMDRRGRAGTCSREQMNMVNNKCSKRSI